MSFRSQDVLWNLEIILKLESPGQIYNLIYWQKILVCPQKSFLNLYKLCHSSQGRFSPSSLATDTICYHSKYTQGCNSNLKVTTKTTLERNWVFFPERDLSDINLTRTDIGINNLSYIYGWNNPYNHWEMDWK